MKRAALAGFKGPWMRCTMREMGSVSARNATKRCLDK